MFIIPSTIKVKREVCKNMEIVRECLSLAGEYAVASELARRNFYTQLTLGNMKKVDLISVIDDDSFCRIEVKSKQGKTWGNIKGIKGNNAFLVFVDFDNKIHRPDFYILSEEDWLAVVNIRVKERRKKKPNKKFYLNDDNEPIWPDQIKKNGKPYIGITLTPKLVEDYKEAWGKIISYKPRKRVI